MNENSGFDTRQFRDAMGHYPSGGTVIGARVGGRPLGFTCQSFHSVSVEPPLVSFGVMKSSTSWPQRRLSDRFSVNLLSESQAQLSSAFARKGVDRWAHVAWRTDSGECPLIEGSLFSLGCELHAEYEAGDHILVVARVTRITRMQGEDESLPLVFYRGNYRKIRTHPDA